MNRLTIFALLIAGCAGTVTETPAPGSCAADADCAAAEFCLVEWSIAPGGPRDVRRCEPRADEGTLCLEDRWCLPGLACDRIPETGGTCRAAE